MGNGKLRVGPKGFSLSARRPEHGSDGPSHVNLRRLKLLAPALGSHRSSAASEYSRTSQKYAQQTTSFKIRENTFPLLAKVGEDSAFSSIGMLAWRGGVFADNCLKAKPKPNSCVWERGLGEPVQRNRCVHTQYEQQVVVRLEIRVSIFMGLTHTCHIVTI